jgi:hypothetical protein
MTGMGDRMSGIADRMLRNTGRMLSERRSNAVGTLIGSRRNTQQRKGIARIQLSDGSIHTAEVHWYEAHGIGRREAKIKHIIS